MRLTRRAALHGLGLAALGAAGGCLGSSRVVRVAVVWSGWELIAFRRVLAAFSRTHNARVEVTSVGNDLGALLSSRATRQSAPDVVFVPQPGLVHDYSAYLVPLPDEIAESYPEAWRKLVTFDGKLLGVWFKSAHKSLVWYRKDVFDEVGVQPPKDWNEWHGINGRLIGAGITPLSVGAASGWVLTDWFENVLLGQDSDAYQRLAAEGKDWTGPAVRTALTLLGDFWRQPGYLWGGIGNALMTGFEQSIVDVFTHRRAAMVMEGDFVYSVINRLGAPGADYGYFRFPFPSPSPTGDQRPVIVGGDVAVLTRSAGDLGRELIDWLASAEAAEIWASSGGFTSVNQGVLSDVYPPGYPMLDQELLHEVRGDNGSGVYFDLSDQLTGRLGGGDGHGLWRILQQFLADIGEGATTAAAVERAVQALDAEAAR